MKCIVIRHTVLLFREYSSQHPWSSCWCLPLPVSCDIVGSCDSHSDEGKLVSPCALNLQNVTLSNCALLRVRSALEPSVPL